MNPSDRSTAGREPLAVELLASDHARRPIGKDRLEFETERHATPPADPIDELLTELRELKPEGRP